MAAQRRDPFRVLIACLLSLRTKDETTGPAAARLFALADTARVILGVCRDLLSRFEGRVPDEIDALLTLKGVGRKTANLVVTQGFNKPGICVDIHVHRISNRLGYVKTRNPEETETALRARLPRRYWIGYNDLLVSFGQNICQPVSPKCSECPVRIACARAGVTRSR